MTQHLYDEQSIRTLDWKEHIRQRPGMYIGKLGDGTSADDGIYILLKEVIDNSIDEYTMGAGKQIDLTIAGGVVTLRDYGRGIPLSRVVDVVSKINTGAKYDSKAFRKSVGLNGVGTKAVNALSDFFIISSYRDGREKTAHFSRGVLTEEKPEQDSTQKNGVKICFKPDESIFKNYQFLDEHIHDKLNNYCYLNAGLVIEYNGRALVSKRGLSDLLHAKTSPEDICYPIVHLKKENIEVALTHNRDYGEQVYSFVNGQYTPQGGTHQQSFREGFVRAVRDFFKKDFDTTDIRQGIVAAIAVKIDEPVFESQTKTKLGSVTVDPNGKTIKSFITEFMTDQFDKFLHKNVSVADSLKERILQSERERKELFGIKKMANERAKKASLHNSHLRDCRFHYNDITTTPHNKQKNDILQKKRESTLFITEGNSASGSITKVRNVETQAVFSLRGKPQNVYGMTKKVVYENKEFNLLQHALNIENGLDGLRYNQVVIATDADQDGMHIRLLLMTYFLQFFPDLVQKGHLFVLNTPLFRVRNKTKTLYCYNETERLRAIAQLGDKAEITRFKGLGEISPEEFAGFIGKHIRLEPVQLEHSTNIHNLLSYYMGQNTKQRQDFIIDNLQPEIDAVTEQAHAQPPLQTAP